MNSGKFIITYTITEKNKKAKDKLEQLFSQLDFKQQLDQSTYLGGNNISYQELEHKLTEIRVHLLPCEEHITVYCVEGETIRQVE